MNLVLRITPVSDLADDFLLLLEEGRVRVRKEFSFSNPVTEEPSIHSQPRSHPEDENEDDLFEAPPPSAAWTSYPEARAGWFWMYQKSLMASAMSWSLSRPEGLTR